jgi:hypothetical protein
MCVAVPASVRRYTVSPLCTAAIVWSIVPAPDDNHVDCEAIGGMRIGRGNRSTQRTPVGGNPATNRLR